MNGLGRQVALVTGASRGFGRAAAQGLARDGAEVVLGYRTARSEAESVAEEIDKEGGRAELMQVDMADTDSVESLAREALTAFGRVDVLVNNAGIMDVRPFVDQELVTWHDMLAVNVSGLLQLTHRLLPQMADRGTGRVINLSSQLGHVGGENFAVYSGTKGFVLAFTRSLAREVGPYGITSNAVCPGSIVTDMNRHIYPPDAAAAKAAELPLRHMGDPRDVAAAVRFLASADAAFITGQCIDVNGGSTTV